MSDNLSDSKRKRDDSQSEEFRCEEEKEDKPEQTLAAVVTNHEFIIFDSKTGLSNLRPWSLDNKANLIVTSPPYYGCRDYNEGVHNALGTHTTSSSSTTIQLGHENSPYEYVRNLAAVFASGSKFLAHNGSLFVVIGDTFARKNYVDDKMKYQNIFKGESIGVFGLFVAEMRRRGWKLWQEIVWNKLSVPPSGAAQVRCNPSTERILWFCLDKPQFFPRYVREEGKTKAGTVMPPVGGKKYSDGKDKQIVSDGKRCRRDIWDVCPSRDTSSHVAPFPTEIVEIAILGCTKPGDLVLDPFGGTLTTQKVARSLNRSSICCDIFDHTGALKTMSSFPKS